MGELKPLGSEKLKGDEKIQRILELTYFNSNGKVNESTNGSFEVIKEGKTGVYGIEKEKDGYYVKKGLNENSLDYIGGLFMKNKNKFSSYNEALKKMEFLVEQEKSTEVIEEATKYVLKQNKPVAPIEPAAPPAEAPIDAAPAAPPEGDMPPMDDMGDEGAEVGEDPNDYMKVLQKMAGKLQQKINKYEDRLESADYKAVIKQILSAVDLDKLEEVDKEDILSMFEDEVGDMGAEPTGDFPTDDQGEVPAPQETAETDGMSLDGVDSLDELMNTPLDEFDEFGDFENDLEDDALSGFDDEFLDDPEIAKAGKMAKKDSGDEFKLDGEKESDSYPIWEPRAEEGEVEEMGLPIQGMGEEEDVDVELDLDELTSMVNSSVKETLGKYFE